jgi:Arc/MetJ family transcription regulator
LDGVKMTLHIDDKLLMRVMRATGAASKTHAIDIALREIDRRAEVKRITTEGLGLSADELKDAFDPASAAAPEELPQVPVSYGSKSRPRR